VQVNVKAVLTIVIALCVPVAARGQSASSPAAIRPAVVRVIAPGHNSISFGSGALVAVHGERGLVLTNWHVVREAAGQITVVFPSGFRSGAKVLRTDRDWDLAALAIWRPNVEPIPLATDPPRIGQPLTIAGYGKGWYRATTGRCTQYVSPGGNLPFEMVELSAAARDGDSGGPILNSRGELAGVLFGASFGSTTGTYCGRIRRFLVPILNDFQYLSAPERMIAQRPRPAPPTRIRDLPAIEEPRRDPRPEPPPIAAIAPRQPPAVPLESAESPSPFPDANAAASQPLPEVAADESPEQARTLGWEDVAGQTRGQQIKTILAAIGLLAILFHGMRLLNMAQGS